MWDVLFKVAFYVVAGLALLLGSCLYVRSLYSTLTGKGEVVIAPFEIIGVDGKQDIARGAILAHMLQAHLQEIEKNIAAAQAQLIGKPPEAVPPTQAEPSSRPVAAPLTAPALTLLPMAPILTQGVGLQTKLFEPTDIKVSVAGVEVGGAVNWMQRQLLNPRTVQFTIYEKKNGVHVTGGLHAMGLKDDSMTLDVRAEDNAESVPLDRVVETIAYELVRRRLMSDPTNQVEALDEPEFQSLVEVLRDTARQNQRVALHRGALPEFRELLERATKLSESVDSWYQLSYLTASIAESAQDWDEADKQYKRTLSALSADAKNNELRKTIESRIADVETKVQQQQASGETTALEPQAKEAKKNLQGLVKEAVDYFNELLGQNLKAPAVKIQTDESLKFSPYYDWTNVVAAPEIQYFPDLAFRNASWAHIARIAGTEMMSKNDAQTDIMYAYADIFTMLAQQHHLKQDEKSSDWVLGRGFIDWYNGKSPSKAYVGTPWESFKEPGTAYLHGPSGKDWQVGDMRNYVTTSDMSRRYINSGILNKAFYLLAMQKTTSRAAEIWIEALRELKRDKPADFPQFARVLYSQAGEDKEAVRASLQAVGLDPTRIRRGAS